MKNPSHFVSALMFAAAMSVGAAACESDVEDKVEDAAEDIEDKAEDAADDIEDKVD